MVVALVNHLCAARYNCWVKLITSKVRRTAKAAALGVSAMTSYKLLHSDKSTLGQGLLLMLQKLRRIRNEAVHSSDAKITTETAREYAALVERVRAELEEA